MNGAKARLHRDGLGRNLALLAGMLAWLGPQRGGPAPEASEHDIKAVFLLNFTKFIDWPAAAFATTRSPLTICILGQDPFGAALDQVVEGEEVNGRKVAVERIQHVPRPKACQVLFVSNSEKDLPAILAEFGPGVLTVGERPGFLRDGGIINFVIEDRHVRFDINRSAAASAGLTLSARLLNVARSAN